PRKNSARIASGSCSRRRAVSRRARLQPTCSLRFASTPGVSPRGTISPSSPSRASQKRAVLRCESRREAEMPDKVLIAHPDPDERARLVTIVRTAGFDAVEAADGEAGALRGPG